MVIKKPSKPYFSEFGRHGAYKHYRACGTMMGIAGFFIPGARDTIEMMYEFEKPFVVDSTKFERAFGMQATLIRGSIKQTVAWYNNGPKSNGGK